MKKHFYIQVFKIVKNSTPSKACVCVLIILGLLLPYFNTTHAQSSCLPNGITFYNQQDVDEFQTDYPDCTEILGDLFLAVPFTNLEFLSQITTIHGSVSLVECDILQDLNGLRNLTHIGSFFRIAGLDFIKDFSGLENLRSVGDLTIETNYSLENLDGLENLASITGDVSIHDNNVLESLSGLSRLEVVNGNVNVYSNSSLESVQGLNQLKSIQGDFYINNNIGLLSFKGLNSLEFIGGSFTASYNPAMENFFGLDVLNSITKDLNIIGNDTLRSLQGLNSLQFIGGQLEVGYNPKLRDLIGLNALDGVGLETIRIINNDSLLSVTGLENINFQNLTQISFLYNDLLNDCAISSICNHLATCGTIILQYNGPFCNTLIDVEAACIAKPEIDYQFNCELQVFPNPTEQFLNINIEKRDPYGIHYTIFDQLGREVAHRVSFGDEPLEQLDIADLPRGAYFLELSSWKISRVIRFIKN